jgi:hypothetical protein
MQKNEPQPWEELYAAAVFETDPSKIADRVNTAQQELRRRWQTLHEPPLRNDRERTRVEDAIRTLNLISQMELDPPA